MLWNITCNGQDFEIVVLKRNDRVADFEREATPRHHRKSERLTGRAQSLQVPASEH